LSKLIVGAILGSDVPLVHKCKCWMYGLVEYLLLDLKMQVLLPATLCISIVHNIY